MSQNNVKRFYLYTHFERFWHWIQALLITLLFLTGFEVHGAFNVFGYERAVKLHSLAGITWVILFVFIVFWLLTTGEWKQYRPTSRRLLAVIRYYAWGIFKGEPHPVRKKPHAKHNPLQRLTYLGLSSVLIPFTLLTGLLFFFYNDWEVMGLGGLRLGVVATLHVAGAFLILIFFIVHIYMTTTGRSPTAHVQAMITGWEEVEEEDEIEDWERRRKKDGSDPRQQQ